MSIELDHLLWAAPDLDLGTALIERLTGIAPARGGAHPGFGTRNSLISLGESYLEVISPDPAQSLDGNRGGVIAALAGPVLVTFAVRTRDLAGYAAAAREAGIEAGQPFAMSRTRPDGMRLDWSLLHTRHPLFGEFIPFAIDWRGSSHPTASAPSGNRLVEFTVLHPEAEALGAIYRRLGIAVPVKAAAKPGFLAALETPRGEVVLTAP